MTPQERKVMELALEALEYMGNYYISLPQVGMQAITVIKEALNSPNGEAQPANYKQCSVSEQLEPVACVNGCSKFFRHTPPPVTETPKRKPLTDEQVDALWKAVPNQALYEAIKVFARAIEAAHGIRPTDFKEKNNGSR